MLWRKGNKFSTKTLVIVEYKSSKEVQYLNEFTLILTTTVKY